MGVTARSSATTTTTTTTNDNNNGSSPPVVNYLFPLRVGRHERSYGDSDAVYPVDL